MHPFYCYFSYLITLGPVTECPALPDSSPEMGT